VRKSAETDKVHGVISYSLDRLSRSLLDFLNFLKLCEEHGAKIICVSQKFDTSTPTGRLMLNCIGPNFLDTPEATRHPESLNV